MAEAMWWAVQLRESAAAEDAVQAPFARQLTLLILSRLRAPLTTGIVLGVAFQVRTILYTEMPFESRVMVGGVLGLSPRQKFVFYESHEGHRLGSG